VQHIRAVSKDGLKIAKGSLYPALQADFPERVGPRGVGRLGDEPEGPHLHADSGREKRLADERRTFQAMILAIGKVLEA
jgi:hypothetical protein